MAKSLSEEASSQAGRIKKTLISTSPASTMMIARSQLGRVQMLRGSSSGCMPQLGGARGNKSKRGTSSQADVEIASRAYAANRENGRGPCGGEPLAKLLKSASVRSPFRDAIHLAYHIELALKSAGHWVGRHSPPCGLELVGPLIRFRRMTCPRQAGPLSPAFSKSRAFCLETTPRHKQSLLRPPKVAALERARDGGRVRYGSCPGSWCR